MGPRRALLRGRTWPAAAGAVLLLALAPQSRADEVASAETIAQGRQIYRAGALGPGRLLTGRVQDDAVLTGAKAACANCHQRSGRGIAEGSTVIAAITGPALAQATTTGSRRRPAYADTTLARAIREGVDAAGQPLHPLMPRYVLTDEEVGALAAYLKTLSAGRAPGVSQRAVRFATVITDDVTTPRRRAMLDVLDACVAEADELARVPAGTRSYGPSRAGSAPPRTWALSRWALTGPPAGWPAQLETYYRAEPVFAVMSGISDRAWRPVHDFCERHEIPCLLPNTPLPDLTTDSFYTMYLSKGLTLEAQVLAVHLLRTSPRPRLLQVFRRDAAGETVADALRRAFAGREGGAVADWPLADDDALDPAALAARLAATRSTAVVLWLPRAAWTKLGADRWTPAEPVKLYGSSTLMGGDTAGVPETLRRASLMIHSLAPQRRIRRLESWLVARGLEPADELVQAQTYFACLVATEGLKRAGEALHRDYFLEVIDRLAMAPMGSGFPRPDFAPGRRYLVNGAFLIEPGERTGPQARRAFWIVP